MQKVFAVSCVVGWGFFYAFSYLAVASLNDAEWMPVLYAFLAFGGFTAGMLCWVRLVGGKRPVLKTAPIRAPRGPGLPRRV